MLLSLSDMFQCGWVFMCMAAILTNEKLLLLSSLKSSSGTIGQILP